MCTVGMSSELTDALDHTNRRTDCHTDVSASVIVENITNDSNHEVSVNTKNVKNECVDGTEEDEVTVFHYTHNQHLPVLTSYGGTQIHRLARYEYGCSRE